MGIVMGIRAWFAVGVLTACMSPTAFADIYKCVGADGQVTYSNMPDKNCKRLSFDPIPAASPASPAAARPAARTPTPASFPKVEENAQKARDNDRRRILESELEAEQKNLAQAKKELAEQFETYFAPYRQRREELQRNPDYVDEVLRKGAERARLETMKTMKKARQAVGLE